MPLIDMVFRDSLRKVLRRSRERIERLRDGMAGIPPVSGGWITPERLRQLIDTPSPTILEVGANDGEHTEWFLGAFESPRVFCFEPDPRAAARFKRRIGSPPGVRLFEIAASDRDGTARFHQSSGGAPAWVNAELPEGWDYSGSLRAPREHLDAYPWVKFESTIEVRTRALDSWAKDHAVGRVDLLWMDVQGAERDVLRGGRELLKRTRFVFTEYSHRELYAGQGDLRDVLSLLPGFKIVARYREDLLLVNEWFVRASGHEGPGP